VSGKRFLLWGCGGHGKVLRDIIESEGHSVVACADGDPERARHFARTLPGQVRPLSEIELFEALEDGTVLELVDAVALAIGNPRRRREAAGRWDRSRLPILAHRRATVSPMARVGAATVIIPGAVVNAGAVLGTGVIVNTNATVGHDAVVEDFAHVAPGANLCGDVQVGAGAWVGAGSVVIQGVSIGRGATVGAGSVVVRDVPEQTVVMGNPARIHRGNNDG